MCSMAMLVALAIPSLMTNSLVSGTVVLLAGALEDDICWPKFQICSKDSLHVSRGYNTCISDNNKSGRRGESLKIKMVKRL